MVDHGTHGELLGRCDGYARLVTAYAREAARAGGGRRRRGHRSTVGRGGARHEHGDRPRPAVSTAASGSARGRRCGAGSSSRPSCVAASASRSRWRWCRPCGRVRRAVRRPADHRPRHPRRRRTRHRASCCGSSLVAAAAVALTAVAAYFVNVRLFRAVRERPGDVADHGVPAHPRPVGADPEHRAARLAGLPRHQRRRHHLDVRPVRRPHAHRVARSADRRDGAHGRLQPAAGRASSGSASCRCSSSCATSRAWSARAYTLVRERVGEHARRRSRSRSSVRPTIRAYGVEERTAARIDDGDRGPPPLGGQRPDPAVLAFTTGQLVVRLTTAVVIVVGTLLAVARPAHPGRAARLPLPRPAVHPAGPDGHRDPQRDAERRRRLAPGDRRHRHPGRRGRPGGGRRRLPRGPITVEFDGVRLRLPRRRRPSSATSTLRIAPSSGSRSWARPARARPPWPSCSPG